MNKLLYIVVNYGEILFASHEKEEAEAFAENESFKAMTRALKELDIDDPSEKDYDDAFFKAGQDEGSYEIFPINLKDADENGIIELEDGTEVEINEILKILKKYR